MRELRYRRRIQFYETDMAGLVHFSWYYRYFEEAEHALWRAAGLTIASQADTIRYPRVSASCEFRAPLRFEDEIDITIAVAAIGSRTIKYDATIHLADALVARGSMTIACIDTSHGSRPRAIDIPTEVAKALS
jgi:acyl-CoA thioester hydrolase